MSKIQFIGMGIILVTLVKPKKCQEGFFSSLL
jgi:hypothetical protein